MKSKGERTREAILKQSFIYSCQFGLGDITIGKIANLCQLSRSGVMAHFNNKEDMQLAILAYAEQMYTARVIAPAKQADPLLHLFSLLEHWSGWVSDMLADKHVSCPFIKTIVEFQNRPDSSVRTFALEQQQRLLDYLTHRINRCVEHNQLTDTVPSKVIAYELYSLYLGHVITHNNLDTIKPKALFQGSMTRLIKSYQCP